MRIHGAIDFGKYFGRLHIHPRSGAPKGHPEVHSVYRGADDNTAMTLLEARTETIIWHSEMTYDNQPPGTSFLCILDTPSAGGHTLFCNQAEAYNSLSAKFQNCCLGSKRCILGCTFRNSSPVMIGDVLIIFAGIEQAQNNKLRGGVVRREPATLIRPVIGTHLTTREKALYLNPQGKTLLKTSWRRVEEPTLSYSHPPYHWIQVGGKRLPSQIPG